MSEYPLVLITGASGLIGVRVAAALATDHRVVALDIEEPPPGATGFVDYVHCDLTDGTSTDHAIAAACARHAPHVASVIHLAAWYDFSGEPSPLYQTLTVEGTRRLLRALHAHAHIEQLVFSSSLLVMQPAQTGAVLDERSPERAEWDYPASKLEAESVLRAERGDIPLVILRLAGAYDERGHSPPLTQQIWRIREKKLESFVFPGDASHGQSFVHLDDVARCFRDVVEHRRTLDPVEVFLIGEPDVLSYGELQDRIGERLHGRAWPTLRIPRSVAKAGAWVEEKTPLGEGEPFIKPWMIDLADAHYPVAIERARQRLGWEPRHRLEDALDAMIEELERDPEGWYRENHLPWDEARETRETAS